jgi:protein arginine kinase activator
MNACDQCGKADATIQYTEVTAGEISRLNLCQSCAKSNGLLGDEELEGVDALISHLSQAKAFAPPEAIPNAVECPTCQWTWKKFEEIGMLGCEDCYKIFAMQLTRMLREAHDAPLHAGPGRRRASDPSALLPELQSLLEQAVREEDYEKAAELRDRIQQLGTRRRHPPDPPATSDVSDVSDEDVEPGGAD